MKSVAQDFAEVHESRRSQRREAGRAQAIVIVIGMLVIVAAGFAGGFMLGQEHGQQKASQAERKRLLEQIGKQQQELENLKKAIGNRAQRTNEPSTQVGDLTFYNTLPKQPVTPAPLNSRSTTAPSVKAPPPAQKRAAASHPNARAAVQMYKLQLGSYQLRANAERLQKRLLQAGFRARIQVMELPGLGQWYRVYVGPFSSLDAAENAKSRVQARLHLVGLLLRVH